MAGIFDIFGVAAKKKASAFEELGVGGTAIYGGYVSAGERNNQLVGANRWTTAADIMTNMSIVAAGLRYFLNLCARPQWRVEPADESNAAKEAADFLYSVIHGTDTSWSRTIRRSGAYRFNGFGLHEWTAMTRPDGRIGIASIEPRPPHTIVKWETDENSTVTGAFQRAPQAGREIYLPRQKLIYMIDDSLSDSPEGLGWFRQLVEPANRLKKYMLLEGLGFERDLRGIPIGRAPITAINAMVASGAMTQDKADAMIAQLRQFVSMRSKQPDTGLVLDSQPFISSKADGTREVSSAMQWGLDLLTGEANSIEALGKSIERVTWDMAAIMGVERLLVGREGAGSLALSEDTSRGLFLNVNSTLGDMAECYDRDLVGPVWALNGLPDEIRPTLTVEDASFRDAEQIARVLADMASAGAVLAHDDPAINDVRDMIGISRPPAIDAATAGLV